MRNRSGSVSDLPRRAAQPPDPNGLDRNRCDAALDDLLKHVPVADSAKADVLARVWSPARRYHDGAHLALLWLRHRAFAPPSLRAEVAETHIACAIAFHDAIYEPGAPDNETRSAELWMDAAAGGVVDGALIDGVAATILATSDHLGTAPANPVRLWMLDLDLTPLGEAAHVFDANTARLREEFASLDDEAWNTGRRAFLGQILARPIIFRTPELRRFEAPSRRNLKRALTEL